MHIMYIYIVYLHVPHSPNNCSESTCPLTKIPCECVSSHLVLLVCLESQLSHIIPVQLSHIIPVQLSHVIPVQCCLVHAQCSSQCVSDLLFQGLLPLRSLFREGSHSTTMTVLLGQTCLTTERDLLCSDGKSSPPHQGCN